MERLAYDALSETGQRCSDAVKIKRSQINAGVISLKQQKTGAEVVIPVSAALLRSARATTAKGIYLLTDKQGRPLPASRLSKIMAQAISDAGLPNRCVAHGLRKALLRRLAEAGATTKQIASVSGHQTLFEIERYTAAAEKRRLAVAAFKTLEFAN